MYCPISARERPGWADDLVCMAQEYVREHHPDADGVLPYILYSDETHINPCRPKGVSPCRIPGPPSAHHAASRPLQVPCVLAHIHRRRRWAGQETAETRVSPLHRLSLEPLSSHASSWWMWTTVLMSR